MPLYYCTLTLHDNVFFATREMGILYETEKYLHNWALSFALFETQYNRIVMPPVSLVSQAQLTGEYWELSPSLDFPDLAEKTCLPMGVFYGASHIVAAS